MVQTGLQEQEQSFNSKCSKSKHPPASAAFHIPDTILQVAIGALESSSKLGLTPLGFHLAHMPVDARIGDLQASW